VSILPRAPGGFRFLFVAINTFTKWMKAMSVVNNTHDGVVKLLKSIIYTFNVPKCLLIDNDSQFKRAKFMRCCADFSISHQASSAVHPQTNDQVEWANELILQGMKARMFHDLEPKEKNWHTELPSVLWSLWTNINRATRETPFHLVYGVDAVLLHEIFLELAQVA
jgi:transposase InsO family protein